MFRTMIGLLVDFAFSTIGAYIQTLLSDWVKRRTKQFFEGRAEDDYQLPASMPRGSVERWRGV